MGEDPRFPLGARVQTPRGEATIISFEEWKAATDSRFKDTYAPDAYVWLRHDVESYGTLVAGWQASSLRLLEEKVEEEDDTLPVGTYVTLYDGRVMAIVITYEEWLAETTQLRPEDVDKNEGWVWLRYLNGYTSDNKNPVNGHNRAALTPVPSPALPKPQPSGFRWAMPDIPEVD